MLAIALLTLAAVGGSDVAVDAPPDAERLARLAEYHARRDEASPGAADQFALAQWCEQHGLRNEAAAHYTVVTRLEPKRAAAWTRLGYRKYEGSWRDPDLEGMGTTLTAMLFDGTRIGMVHIGDSRAYLRTEDETSQISHDDTLVQKLVDEGKLTPEQASVHPHRSAILYALMGTDDITPDLSIRQAHIGDRYLLCSDGVSDYIPDMIPGQVLGGPAADALALADPQDAADRLIELALEGGGRDNISCIVADIVEEGAGTEEPVIEGAAAEHAEPVGPDTSAALRTAELAPKRQRFARRRRRVLFGAGVLIVLLALAGGFLAWLQSQYFVKGVDGKVAVYRGVNASVAGIHLYRQVRVSNLQVADLVSTARKSVHDGLEADNRSDANAIVSNLSSHELLPLCPQPAPAPKPSQNQNQNNHGKQDRNKQHRSTPSPTPSPTPTVTPVPGKDCR